MSNYSNDSDLAAYEPNILNYLPETNPQTTSFEAQHAEAKRILDEVIIRRLPEGIKARLKRGEATMNDIVDENDLKTVSVFYTLFSIFNWLSASETDIFAAKSARYLSLFKEKLEDLTFDISLNGDSSDTEDEVDTGNIRIERG